MHQDYTMEIFEKGTHKIIHGDVFDALNNIPDNSIDLIFADPPYDIPKLPQLQQFSPVL